MKYYKYPEELRVEGDKECETTIYCQAQNDSLSWSNRVIACISINDITGEMEILPCDDKDHIGPTGPDGIAILFTKGTREYSVTLNIRIPIINKTYVEEITEKEFLTAIGTL